MTRGRVFLALLPVCLGLLLDLLLHFVFKLNYIFFLRADIGILALLAGLLLSILVGGVLFGYQRLAQGRRRMVFQARDERLRLLRRLDHELKNPLTAMRAGLANLAEPAGEEARQEVLDSIEAQVLRLSRLSVSLRKLADLEDRLVERSPVDIPALLQEAMDTAQDIPDAENRQLNLNLIHTPIPNVTGDADLLLLAIHNLLENAVKFTCRDDRIELRAFEEGASIVIQVADTGPGIPEEEQPHVWEELYRGKGGRGIPGSGLGLALVRTIMERHHGEATLRSQVGEGTIFSLRLPANRVTNR